MRQGGLVSALLFALWVLGCVTPANAQAPPPLPYPECLYDHDGNGVVNFAGDAIDVAKVAFGIIPAHAGGCDPAIIPTWTPTPSATTTATPTSTALPSPSSTTSPSSSPTASPTAIPTATSTPTPTAVPTATRTPTPTATAASLRDPLKQPFASTSIWNMPIGSGAQRTPARLHTPSWGTFVDPNYWINRPASPSVTVRYSSDAWKKGLTNGRCNPDGGTALTAPLPSSLIIPGSNGEDTPNNAAAILLPDGRTILQTQPLTHCTTTGPWTTYDVAATVDIYGEGIPGAHGGSGLSSLGGTVRLGELVHGGKIPHAMQWILSDGDFNCSGGCFRWPATRSDCGASTTCYPNTGTVGVKPGALLALPTTYNCAGLRTEPGRIVCHAMQDYGGYIVDAGWDPHYFTTETGPDGSVTAEFQTQWGFALSSSTVGPWALDIHEIMGTVDLIANNSATSIGGGGTPRVPLAPPLQ